MVAFRNLPAQVVHANSPLLIYWYETESWKGSDREYTRFRYVCNVLEALGGATGPEVQEVVKMQHFIRNVSQIRLAGTCPVSYRLAN
jgi:hypothetical protein